MIKKYLKKGSYASDAVYNTMGNIIYFFSIWITTVLVVKVSGYDNAGILSVAMTIANVFFVVAHYGLRSYQSSDYNNDFRNSHYMASRYMTSLLGFGLCLFFCLICKYDSKHIKAIMLYMTFKGLEAFSDVIYGIWQKSHKLKYAGVTMSLKGILSTLMFSLILWKTQKIIWAIAAMCIGVIIFVAYEVYLTIRWAQDSFQINKKDIRISLELLRLTFPMFIVSICPMILQAIPKLIFERLFSTSEMGIYSSISSPTIIIPTFVSCIMIPYLPIFAESITHKNKKKLAICFASFFGGTLVIGILSLIFIKLFGGKILSIIYNDELGRYVDLLILIIVSVILTCFLYCFNALFISARKLSFLAIVYVLTNIVCYIFSCVYINSYGIYGIAYTLISSQIIQCMVLSIFSFLLVRKM